MKSRFFYTKYGVIMFADPLSALLEVLISVP
jgi:hypothetical protein